MNLITPPTYQRRPVLGPAGSNGPDRGHGAVPYRYGQGRGDPGFVVLWATLKSLGIAGNQ